MEAEGSLAPGRPVRFTEMPLRDDLLPAGPKNPVGVQAGAPPVPGERALPNIEPARPGGPSTGFGPVSPSVRGHGSHAGFDWAYRLQGPPPEGFDFAFFNAAPPDQQLERISPGSSLRLTHLSRELPILETRLPDLRPRAFVARAGAGAPREVELRCDTLLIDADRGLALLSFRGAIPIDAEDWDEGTLGVALEEPDGPSVASRLAQVLGTGPAPEREAIHDEPSDFGPPPWPALHEDERPMDPARASPEGPLDEETAASDGDFARHTAELALVDVLRSAAARPVLPFVHAASPPAIATIAAVEAPFTSDEPATGEAYDPRTAKPVLPFRSASGPAAQHGPASSPAPVASPHAGHDGGYPPAPGEPAHGGATGGPLRFPPAPPLGPTPGRFVTASAASPPPMTTVPRAPTFGGPPPPSSPGSAIPKLPPIPGKPTRSG